MSMLATIQRLTREEQDALALAARAGDTDARNRLIESLTPLLLAQAKRLSSRACSLTAGDLLSEGIIAAIAALPRWDTSRGVPFAPYAARRAAGAMRDAIRSFRPMIRTPRNRTAPAVQPLGDTQAESLPGGLPDPSSVLDAEDLRAALDEILDTALSAREAEILRRRLALEGADETAEQTAAALGLTPSRVWNAQRWSIRRLAERWPHHPLAAFAELGA